jgi:hypothetical protein
MEKQTRRRLNLAVDACISYLAPRALLVFLLACVVGFGTLVPPTIAVVVVMAILATVAIKKTPRFVIDFPGSLYS